MSVQQAHTVSCVKLVRCCKVNMVEHADAVGTAVGWHCREHQQGTGVASCYSNLYFPVFPLLDQHIIQGFSLLGQQVLILHRL